MTLILWHGGKLTITEDEDVMYEGGEMCVWEDIPWDTFNCFDVHNLWKTHGYHSFERIWWRNRQVEEPGMYQLRQILTDNDTISMCNVSISTNGEIEVYFEHPILDYPVNAEVPVLQDVNADEVLVLEENDEVSDDSIEIVETIQKGKAGQKEKGKTSQSGKKRKVAEKGKRKVVEKGKGKVAEKGRGKAADVGASKRKRKQEKVVDSSENASDDLGYVGNDGFINSGSDSDSDDSLYVPPPPPVGEAGSWSMDEDNQSYDSEYLHSPVSTDDEGRRGLRPTFPQHDEFAGFGSVRNSET